MKPSSTPKPKATTAEGHETLGRELTQAGQLSEAIVELTEAIKLSPDLARAYNARGYAYLRSHDYPHALADLNEAIRLNPTYRNAYANRAVAKKALGDAAGAAADLEKAR